jgi:hypothetical protein
MKKTILLLMVGMIFLAPSCQFIKSHNPFGKKARIREQAIKMQMDSIRITDSLNFIAAQQQKERIRQDSLAFVESQKSAESSQKYHIIVGSFLTPDYATAYSAFYSDKGYQSKIVDMTGGRFKLVAASSYDNMHDAWKALKGYRDTVEYEAWIYVSE